MRPKIDRAQGPQAWSKNDRAGGPKTNRRKSPGQLGPGRWQAEWSTDAEVEKEARYPGNRARMRGFKMTKSGTQGQFTSAVSQARLWGNPPNQ